MRSGAASVATGSRPRNVPPSSPDRVRRRSRPISPSFLGGNSPLSGNSHGRCRRSGRGGGRRSAGQPSEVGTQPWPYSGNNRARTNESVCPACPAQSRRPCPDLAIEAETQGGGISLADWRTIFGSNSGDARHHRRPPRWPRPIQAHGTAAIVTAFALDRPRISPTPFSDALTRFAPARPDGLDSSGVGGCTIRYSTIGVGTSGGAEPRRPASRQWCPLTIPDPRSRSPERTRRPGPPRDRRHPALLAAAGRALGRRATVPVRCRGHPDRR